MQQVAPPPPLSLSTIRYPHGKLHHHHHFQFSILVSMLARVGWFPQSNVSTPLCPVPTPFSYPVNVGPSSHIQTMSSCSYLCSWHQQAQTLYNVTPIIHHSYTPDVQTTANVHASQPRQLLLFPNAQSAQHLISCLEGSPHTSI